MEEVYEVTPTVSHTFRIELDEHATCIAAHNVRRAREVLACDENA